MNWKQYEHPTAQLSATVLEEEFCVVEEYIQEHEYLCKLTTTNITCTKISYPLVGMGIMAAEQ